MDPTGAISQAFWHELVTTGMFRERAHGAVMALAWLIGAEKSASCMASRRDGQGRRIAQAEFEVMTPALRLTA